MIKAVDGHSVLLDIEEQYRAQIAKMFPLAGIVIITLHLIDIYQSYSDHYSTVLYWEGIHFGIIGIIMILFRYVNLSIQKVYYAIMLLELIYFYGTLFLPDRNYALSLAWMLFLTGLPFWLFTSKTGLVWSVSSLIILSMITIGSFIGWVHTLYEPSLLLQVLGLQGLTIYMLYGVNKERLLYQENIRQYAKSSKLLYEETLHRSKNNLQLIIGLIEQEQKQQEQPPVKAILDKLTYRVRAFDIILSSRPKKDTAHVDMYLTIQRIVSLYQKESACQFILDMDPIILPHQEANHIALITNEALNNVMKYACPNGATQTTVGLKALLNNRIHLFIYDNGLQKPTNTYSHTGGTRLMKGLAESLPEGSFSCQWKNGIQIDVIFRI